MTRTLSFVPSPADIALEIGEVPRASPLILTGPATDGYESYAGALWRNPRSVHTAGALPLAAADGSIGDGTASLEFSATDLALDLLADCGYYDDLWLVVSAVRESQTEAVRWGWMRLVEAGLNPLAGVLNAPLAFSIVDDVCSITYGEVVYILPVVPVGASDVSAGLVTISADTFYFHQGGLQWSAACVPVTPPSGAVAGQGVVIDDVLYVTLSGVSYTATVVLAEPAPSTAPTSTSTLVTGSDGAQYERTEYEDGEIRFKPVYEDIAIVPGEIPESGTTLVTGTDGAEYERTVYYDGTIRFKPTYEELP